MMDAEKLTLELKDPDEEIRKEAVLAITEMGDPELIPALRAVTSDPSPAVRFFARRGIDRLSQRIERASGGTWQRALEAAAGDSISTTVWRQMLSDADAEARLMNVMASLRISDPAIVPLLAERLEPENDPRVRASLVKALGRFRRKDTFELVQPLLADADPRVRANAIEALDDLADPRLEPLLEPFLKDDDNRIRGNALKALARFDRPRTLRGAHEMAAAPEVWMRATAIWLLRELGGKQAEGALAHMAHRELGELSEKAEEALQALRRSQQARALPKLVAGREAVQETRVKLESPRPDVRMEGIAEALELPRQEAVGLLKAALLTEQHVRVLATLVKALGVAGSHPHVKVIAGFLEHSDARVRANAIEGLAELGALEAFELVEPMLKDRDQRVRANAAWLLHGRDPEKAFAALKEMLLSRQAAVQDSALYALREIGTEQVLEVFESALASDDPEVRIKVFAVLDTWAKSSPLAAKLGETYRNRGPGLPWVPEKLEDLVLELQASSTARKLRVLEKIATFRSAEARQRLETAARDPEAPIRKRARELLKERDYQESLREAYFRLGLAAYQWFRKAGEEAPSELAAVVGRIKSTSRDMEAGRDVLVSLSLRRQALVELGKEVQLLIGTGQIPATGLEDLVREIARLEMRHEVADLPPPVVPQERPYRIWLRVAAGVAAGIGLGVGLYYLFRMPPSPNMKRLVVTDAPRSQPAAAATTATTSP